MYIRNVVEAVSLGTEARAGLKMERFTDATVVIGRAVLATNSTVLTVCPVPELSL